MYHADESGFDEHYSREYSQTLRKGCRKSQRRHFSRTDLVAAKNGREIITTFAFSSSMDGDLFEGGLEHVLVPALKKTAKKVLILDNSSFHRKNAIYDIADEYGFRVIFLPPYSTDLNPIEKFWVKVKSRLRLHMHKFTAFGEALCHAFH